MPRRPDGDAREANSHPLYTSIEAARANGDGDSFEVVAEKAKTLAAETQRDDAEEMLEYLTELLAADAVGNVD